MESFSNEMTVNRPVHDVFTFLAAFKNVPKWNHAITETVKTSPGPVTVGTTYRQRRHLPKVSEESFAVTGFRMDSFLAIEGTLGPFPARVTYQLEPSGDGTVVRNTVELEMTGPLRLVGGIAASRVKTSVAENLEVLKRLLEADQD